LVADFGVPTGIEVCILSSEQGARRPVVGGLREVGSNDNRKQDHVHEVTTNHQFETGPSLVRPLLITNTLDERDNNHIESSVQQYDRDGQDPIEGLTEFLLKHILLAYFLLIHVIRAVRVVAETVLPEWHESCSDAQRIVLVVAEAAERSVDVVPVSGLLFALACLVVVGPGLIGLPLESNSGLRNYFHKFLIELLDL
jgi:hypothetical protein